MLQTEFHENRPSGSEEEDLEEVLTSSLKRRGLGHVTLAKNANFRSSTPWSLHMKFDFNRPSGSGGEDV